MEIERRRDVGLNGVGYVEGPEVANAQVGQMQCLVDGVAVGDGPRRQG